MATNKQETIGQALPRLNKSKDIPKRLKRIHNEWFQPVQKTARNSAYGCGSKGHCPCGANKIQLWSWGNYIRAKWNTIDYFCKGCFRSRILPQIKQHAAGCGCVFSFNARCGHGPLPAWLKPPKAICALTA